MYDLFPKFDFSARRAELSEELETVAAQLPALRAAHQAAETTAENARYRYESFLKRATLATRHGNDTASPALRRLLDEELQLMRAANSAATRARLALENAEWMAACRRSDVEQIDLLQNPPPIEHRPLEVVRRPKPQAEDGYDTIVMPTAA